MSGTGVLDRRHRSTTVGLLVLVTFVAFEAMAVATAMPTAVTELDGLAWYGWPFTAFLVAQVVGMVVGGEVGDRRGPRAALLWGVAVFAAGLLASGLAADRVPSALDSGRPAEAARASGFRPSGFGASEVRASEVRASGLRPWERRASPPRTWRPDLPR